MVAPAIQLGPQVGASTGQRGVVGADLRKRCALRLAGLKNERNSWDALYHDLADNLAPFSGAFDYDQASGMRRQASFAHIYDATAIISVQQTAAGMMSYGTSPARPWHRNTVSDPDLQKRHEVLAWLDDVTRLQRDVLEASNTYLVLPMLYSDLLVFGTAACLVMDDPESVVRLYPLSPGSYWLAQDHTGRVDTCYREFAMTTAQIVERWPDTHSKAVAAAYRAGQLDTWWTIVHVVEPRREHGRGKTQKDMPFRSVYYENATSEGDGVLAEGGYRKFPVLAPRWWRKPNQVYGVSPGMMAVPFASQLQAMTLVKGKAAQAIADPAWQLPPSLKNSPDVDTEPGGHSFVDQSNPNGGIRPLREARIDLAPITADIYDVRQQVRAALFADLFTMLVEAVEGRMTAAEFGMRVQQKMLMLGPVVQSLNSELLSPLLERIYDALLEGGVIPVPPPEAQGAEFRIEFMGVLAQAQRASGVAAAEQFLLFAKSVAEAKPDVLDSVDFDAMLRSHADMLGVDPDNLMSPERVQELRVARANAEAAKEQMAMIEQQSVAARNFGSVNTAGQNMMTNPAGPVGQFAGYGAGSV